MLSKHKVMIFPAGSEIGLEIFASLKYSHHLEVYGASGKSDHASYLYPKEKYIEDSRLYVDSCDFIELFNYYIEKFGIGFIYPTHDTVAFFLSQNQEKIYAKIVGSCFETNKIARSKSLTYKEFNSFEFCPRVLKLGSDLLEYPLFLKPDRGQGGKGSFKVDSETELDFYLNKFPELLVMEFLPGDELSVDCFSDFEGRLIFCGPRTRERVQMGISFRSKSVDLTDEIRRIAESINERLSFKGSWFFQVKKDKHGSYKLLEFAPRQSSTMGLYRHSGVNFALLGFFTALDMPVNILCNDYSVSLDRCLHNRYKADLNFKNVYIDFDETIVNAGSVNERVVSFIYQCKNNSIKVILITKHKENLDVSLFNFGISKNLFNEIIHLTEDQEKWCFIDPDGSIFIDNYWYDRKAVKDNLGIPVFDVDAVDCLLV